MCEPVQQQLMGKLFKRAAPKVKIRETYVRVLFAREIFTRLFSIAKLLKVLVARDGIEPPTPAFSEPLTVSQKWFEINQISLKVKSLWRR